MVSLAYDEKSLRMCLTISTEYQCVTDRLIDKQTDRQRSCHSIVRAIHMHRAVIRISEGYAMQADYHPYNHINIYICNKNTSEILK